ncbi:MAG: hypothetical protein IT556_16320 [Acetobacteraceae bacterium]|nr:hypothetical protein [Acetobacteraceae bacterium]
MSATLKLPRALRLDASDRFVFADAAEPGEWCVVGSFAFAGAVPESLSGKRLAAFRSGFLGVGSCGWSTLVVATEASLAEHDAARAALAATLCARFGCPDPALALAAADEEIAFAAELCAAPPAGTVIALTRAFESGAIRETFRTLAPRAGPGPGTPFRLIEVAEEAAAPPDLAAMARGER